MVDATDTVIMEPELTPEEIIKILEELHREIPKLILIIKLSQHKRAPVDPHVDDAVEAVDAQGHPEIRQNIY